MSSIGSLMQIALTGLSAAQTGLATTGDNIANANSPGYSRETVIQTPQVPYGQTGVIQGSGVEVTAITRNFSQFAQTRLWQATAGSSAATQRQTSMAQLNNILSTSGVDLTPALSGFFQSLRNLAGNPSGATERQAMVSAAATLANRFNAIGGAIRSLRRNVNDQITGTVAQVNTLTAQIARLNVEIGGASQPSGASQPNGLLDQRDHLITQLNQLVGISVLKQSQGSYSVFTANGQALVTGSKAFQLATRPNALDGQNLDVVYAPSGAVVSNGISGGTLGGLFAARATIAQAQNSLGQIAVAVGADFNRRQSLGIDLNGTSGPPLFAVPTPQVGAAANNTGSAILTATLADSSKITGANYELQYQGGNWAVQTWPGRRSVSPTVSGNTLSFDGLTVTVSGTPANGDRFLLKPTAGAATGIQAVLTDPNTVAAALPYVSSPGRLVNGSLSDTNTGNVTISPGQVVTTPAAGATVLPATEFGQALTIQFTAPGSYQVSDASGVVAGGSYSSGATLALAYPSPPAPAGHYWQVTLSGSAPKTLDSFVLQPAGSGDNRNALAMSALASAQTLGNGSASFSQAYANLTGMVGNSGQQAKLTANSEQATLNQAQQAQQSISGVNLNEEAANMLRYQQAFQASAKAIGIAAQLFNSILNL